MKKEQAEAATTRSSKFEDLLFCRKWYSRKYLQGDIYFNKPLDHYYLWGRKAKLSPNKWLKQDKILNYFSDQQDECKSFEHYLSLKLSRLDEIGILPGVLREILNTFHHKKRYILYQKTLDEICTAGIELPATSLRECLFALGIEKSETSLFNCKVIDLLRVYSQSTKIPLWCKTKEIKECNPDLHHLNDDDLYTYILENLSQGRQLSKFDNISPKSLGCLLYLGTKNEKFDPVPLRTHEAKYIKGIEIGVVFYQNSAAEAELFLSTLLTSLRQLKETSPNTKTRLTILHNSPINPETSNTINQLLQSFKQELVETVEIPFSKNLGFGGGHNYIVSQIGKNKDDFLYLCVNPDGAFFSDSLTELSNEAIKYDINSCIFEAMLMPKRHPKYFCFTTLKTNWASGACFAISIKKFKELKGFDENIFMYCEDVDLSIRAHSIGMNCYTIPSFKFWHDTLSRDDSSREGQMRSSAMYVARKHNLPNLYFDQFHKLKKLSPTKYNPSRLQETRPSTTPSNQLFRYWNRERQLSPEFTKNLHIGDLHFSQSSSNF